ncbi:MAG: exodeoxyribonuclease VII small subunit [Rectinema sp.]
MKDFEKRLDRLESLAERIKEPDIPLEEALDVFEEGMKLSKGLKKDLDRMQAKVQRLLSEPEDEGEAVLEDLDQEDGEESEV